MALSLRACILLLKEHHLLKSAAIQNTEDVDMTGIAYDSRKVSGPTLFSAKATSSDQFIFPWPRTTVRELMLPRNLTLKATA
ncbi:UDP-N-acetylmuramoylalanyl-D-glutamate--2,6-diaminopimelate ligase [Lacticaseibacillus paracasei subsp. paracasei Lpp126]|uniref:UDP-N-acetylmuramoylalanyl-D-glutamate--2, 6-diaminopimelate ligase n=1 Tax=Lacticaseibacillus paracasei subsp. paracasei Lpp126 TaxID=1256206 RepID=S2RB12_LACPA|nr:UDP-N-acetylmuramoylalanyl-D-glutamate--2,6-diaminopimelate ligase [Lacticaseibacillus paracasei subsp. paracasei Lpp126]